MMQGWLLASAAAWVAGCGVQGTPHPPRLERPAKITTLSVAQVGQNIEMHFTLPDETTEGGRIVKPLEIEILRALAPRDPGLSKLPEPEVWTRLTRQEWLAYAQGNAIAYTAHLTAQEFRDWRGQTLALGVRTLTRGFRHRPLESDSSNFADVPILDVSPPLAGVHCVITEQSIQVQFPPPIATLAGEPVHDLAGYRIYRSSTGQPGSFGVVGETTTSPYEDHRFVFGQTYYYEVAAVFGKPDHLATSSPSSPVKVTPQDVFPPKPPTGLSGIYTAGAVEMVWTASTEPDLAGYNVYRVEGQTAKRANRELLRTPIFRDANAPAGKTVTYYVTAVDSSGNESGSSQAEEVETK